MNSTFAQRLGHVSLIVLFLSGLAGIGHLTWTEIARLAAISLGLVLAFARYRKRTYEAEVRFSAAALLALTCAYTVTQFDPGTSIVGRYGYSSLNWFVQVVQLAACLSILASVFFGPDRSSLSPGAWNRIDRVVMVVIGMVTVITVLSALLIAEQFGVESGKGLAKIFGYACIWLGVTRLYSRESWELTASGLSRHVWHRWSGALILALGLFVPTLVYGGIRTGQVFYHFREGQRAYANGEFADARTSYEAADRWNKTLRLASIHDAYFADLAILNLREGGNADEMIASIRESTLDPLDSDRKVANIYSKADRWEEAARLLENTVGVTGREDLQAIDDLGKAYLELADASGFLALADKYEYVPKVTAETFDEVMLMGSIHFYRQTYGEALSYFERGRELRPGDSYANYRVGRVLSAQGNWQAAIAAYEQALSADGSLADAHYRIGESREALGDATGAIADYQKATKLLPNHLDAALALRRLGS